MARRKTQVLRKLDDPVKLGGVVTVRTAGLLCLSTVTTLYSEVTLSLFSGLFGRRAGLPVMLVIIASLALALVAAERHEDEHFVPSLVRYYASGRWRGVFAAGVVAPCRRPALRPLALLMDLWALGVRRTS